MTKFLNTDLDSTLGGLTPSDEKVSSQKAVKTYVDNADTKKVDKTSTASQVYVTNASGNQSTLSYSQSNSADSIAQRDADGQITVNQTPTANDHAASKKYVDDGLSDKQAVLVSGTNIKTINNQSLLGSGNIDIQTSSPLPDMTDQSGKYLTTDGTSASWNALAAVATSGSYEDLSNKPTIPAAQQQVDWNASSGITSILNKPTLANVATSGDYEDLTNKPTIPASVTVDQTYSATSTNAQSGTAVASAISEKQDTVTGAATTITSSNLTSNRALISNDSGKVAVSTTTSTELGYVNGVTSSIQTQLNNKVAKNTDITGGTKCKITYDSKGLVTSGADLVEDDIPDLSLSKIKDVTATAAEVNVLDGITASTTELNYVDGVTSAIQTQLDGKQETLVGIGPGQNIKTINDNSLLGSGNITIDSLPSQTGQDGKFLTTDGATASWQEIPAGGTKIIIERYE